MDDGAVSYAAALREWRPFAEQGDADAQLNLGLMYANGWKAGRTRWTRPEAQNDGLVAEMRDMRESRDELERRLTTLMQQQALADLSAPT